MTQRRFCQSFVLCAFYAISTMSMIIHLIEPIIAINWVKDASSFWPTVPWDNISESELLKWLYWFNETY